VERLFPAFHNTSITTLRLVRNNIQGQRGGDVLRALLVGNNNITKLDLEHNPIGPEGALGLGQGLPGSTRLQSLNLWGCSLGNDGLANLLPACGESMMNNILTHVNLGKNNIEGATGGDVLELLLLRFPQLKVLQLCENNLGPLGAKALASGLMAAACQLKKLYLDHCGLGNDGVANLVPNGHVNRSLTRLTIFMNNICGTEGGENILALAARCTNLDSLGCCADRIIGPTSTPLHAHQYRRLASLLDRKRLCTAANALAGSNSFSILFRFVEEMAHGHDHGLGAIFVILQNDGEDHFCNAYKRAIS
jgi:Leucine Rich repeat